MNSILNEPIYIYLPIENFRDLYHLMTIMIEQFPLSAYNVRALVTSLQELTGRDFEAGSEPASSEPMVSFRTEGSETEPETPALSLSTGNVPLCPKCQEPMVLRTVKKSGPHYGKQFWGCPDYPRCRGVRPLEIEKE